MRISDWSSDVCSSDLHADWQAASAPHIWLAFLRADLRRPPAPGRFRVQATCAYSFPQALVIVFRLRQRRTADEKPRPMLAPMARASLAAWPAPRSEEHTSELQSLMRISYAVFCLKQQTDHKT